MEQDLSMAPENGMKFVAVDEKAVRSGARLGDANIESCRAGQGYPAAGRS
jgi:hypothetical protein